MQKIARLPEISQVVMERYMRIPKADWAEVYFDLYRQAYGEAMRDEDIMSSVEHRRKLIQMQREDGITQDEMQRLKRQRRPMPEVEEDW